MRIAAGKSHLCGQCDIETEIGRGGSRCDCKPAPGIHAERPSDHWTGLPESDHCEVLTCDPVYDLFGPIDSSTRTVSMADPVKVWMIRRWNPDTLIHLALRLKAESILNL